MDYKIEFAQHTICVLELPTLKSVWQWKATIWNRHIFFSLLFSGLYLLHLKIEIVNFGVLRVPLNTQ